MAATLKAVLSFDGRAYEAGMKKAATTAKKTQSNIVGSLKGAVAGALSVGFIASKANKADWESPAKLSIVTSPMKSGNSWSLA